MRKVGQILKKRQRRVFIVSNKQKHKQLKTNTLNQRIHSKTIFFLINHNEKEKKQNEKKGAKVLVIRKTLKGSFLRKDLKLKTG